MEARIILLSWALTAIVSSAAPSVATAQYYPSQRPNRQQYRTSTEHFVVTASDPQLCKKVAEEAERYRKELAIEWLGQELGPWRDRCPIQVEVGMHAGGETSFAFIDDGGGQGVPVSWQMKIFGPPDRLLDAVLPHEVTHTIFATHFGRPLPRWADEGACTTVEHESEKQKNHTMLMDFLKAQPSRGIPFNRMFVMREYPHDILPLYAQGYSLAKFLIMKKGRRYFLDYVASGMNSEGRGRELAAWNSATEKYYGYEDLSELQLEWLGWVRNGSRQLASESVAVNLAEPNRDNGERKLAVAPANSTYAIASTPQANSTGGEGSWYARQAQSNDQRVATNRQMLDSRIDSPQPAMPPDNGKRLDLPQANTIWR